ncbi:S-methyl-5-thioribose-1-phosphate isomerase [Thioalkalivibrio denitrificans]|uniref:Methylthioribose-1-phosphate isomerase n=1 Tax=Thioalkalivibrio denitrificans TaxID=108003 RepID=A0A1V3NJV4_9GAMM|nr:S-methyl-5-thioribose-1-phosphate isomerase [Thioalkalivibrio denitrificans]OOG25178.1 S-methyl-5-thioribose-1-phosphate isomerase [Thioalkalivibrio denitrificans]
MNNATHDTVRAVQWSGNHLRLLDQRLLPAETVYLDIRDAGAVAEAIRDMVVRGAPAIGITAAYGVVLAARALPADTADWPAALEPDMQRLAAARPTAVNLFWALARMRGVLEAGATDVPAALEEEARRIHDEDLAANRRMGELGAALLGGSDAVLTHCNTGSLATGGYGTALGVIRSAFENNRISRVYADETRPWLQGSRLTAWELVQDGIPVDLVCEGAAASLMRQGRVSWVVVGADRIAANGDTANKIGTYALAVLARHHGVRFMVVAPTSTIDMDTPDGAGIPIEERPPAEVLSLAGHPVAADGAGAWNPAFDVTPADLIDAIVTERGVVERPDRGKMETLMGRMKDEG